VSISPGAKQKSQERRQIRQTDRTAGAPQLAEEDRGRETEEDGEQGKSKQRKMEMIDSAGSGSCWP
jgi:hypothetical protein